MPTDEVERWRSPRAGEPSFDPPESEQGAACRAHPRFRIPRTAALTVTVGILGAKPLRGIPINISRGGLNARFANTIRDDAEGQECFLRFTEVGEELRPHSTFGRVRRVETQMGYVLVAVEFADPLENLDLPQTWKT